MKKTKRGSWLSKKLSLPGWVPRLLLILVAGFAVRIWWAGQPGYIYDIGVNQGWAKSAALLGFARSYAEQVDGNQLPSYPPLSILMFGTTAHLFQWIWPGGFGDAYAWHFAIKLPAILADLGISIVAFFFLKRWSIAAGLAGALIYALHPAAIHDSALWGQTDSIYSLALFASVTLAAAKRWGWAGVLMAAACLLKPQAIPAFPILTAAALLAGWRPFLRYTAGGAFLTFIVLLPFMIGGTLPQIVGVYTQSVGGYFNLMTHNAFNLWFALYAGPGWRPDTELFFGLVTYRTIGFGLFGAAMLWILGSMWRSLRPAKGNNATVALALALCSALACYAFFVLLTQMHERYMFAVIVLGLPLIVTGKRGIALYVALSLLFWFNLFDLLPMGGQPMLVVLHEFVNRSAFAATLQVAVFVLTCLHVREFLRDRSKGKPGLVRATFAEIGSAVWGFFSPFFHP